jgi:hypothetical protein
MLRRPHTLFSRVLFILTPVCFLAVSCSDGGETPNQPSIVLTKGDVQIRSSALHDSCGSLVDGFNLAIDGVLPAGQPPNSGLPSKYTLEVVSVNDGGVVSLVGKLLTRNLKDIVTTSYLSAEQISKVCKIIQGDWKELTDAVLEKELDSCKVDITGDQLVGTFIDLRAPKKALYVLRWGLDLIVDSCDNPVAHKALKGGVNSFIEVVSQ